jgi:hypothetical protein
MDPADFLGPAHERMMAVEADPVPPDGAAPTS